MDQRLGRTYRFEGITFEVVGYDPVKGLRLWSATLGFGWCSLTLWSGMQAAGMESL